MRLAFLTALIPVARPDTGFEIANAAILDALRSAGHEVTAIGFLRPGETAADAARAVVLDRVDIENAAVPAGRKLQWLAHAFVNGLPVACAKLRLAGRGRLLEAIAENGPFDAFILNSVMLPGAFPELASLGPSILVEHNIEHVSARQNAAHAKTPMLRWLYAREARLLEAIERRLWREADFIWTLAEEDRAVIGAEHRHKSAALPLISGGAPSLHERAGGSAAEFDVGLIGTWTWAPNFTGLDWFLREVCPLLPSGLTVAVAGRLPADMPPIHPQARLLGRVPDAGAFLRSCRVLALSSRAGTGVQLKTIEAMQLGMPAVATALSCRGFSEIPPNFTRADSAEAFAAALVERVEAARAGQDQRIDGAAFLAGQRAELASVLARGLAAATR